MKMHVGILAVPHNSTPFQIVCFHREQFKAGIANIYSVLNFQYSISSEIYYYYYYFWLLFCFVSRRKANQPTFQMLEDAYSSATYWLLVYRAPNSKENPKPDSFPKHFIYLLPFPQSCCFSIHFSLFSFTCQKYSDFLDVILIHDCLKQAPS